MKIKYESCCGSEIQKLARLTYILEKNTFKLKGFTSSQAYTLLALLESGELSMREISERMALDCSTMTRNISKLVDLGLVERCSCHSDRRITRISLSELGRIKTMEIREAFMEHFGQVVCKLPKEKFDIIFEGINLLTEVLEEERSCNEKK
jgi:DNA-binding MarR family transcriptional regulator